MTSETIKDIKYVCSMCSGVTEVLADGDFSDNKNKSYLIIYVDTEDNNKAGEYLCNIVEYLFDKYDMWDRFPRTTTLVLCDSQEDVFRKSGNYKRVYMNGVWLI